MTLSQYLHLMFLLLSLALLMALWRREQDVDREWQTFIEARQ